MPNNPREFYEACGLSENPFMENPAVASHERASVWVGYEKENRRLMRVLKQARSDQLGSTRFFLLYGSYGTGKSHAFLWAQNLILHKEKAEFNACVYFIRSLKTQGGKFSFHRAFQEYVVNQSQLLDDMERFSYFLKDKISKYKEEFDLEPQEDPKRVIEQIFKAPELSNLALKFYQANNRPELEKAIVVKDDFDSILRFTSLVKLFTFPIPSKTIEDNRFKKAIYLFIDELDDLIGTPPKEARLVNDHLRHLYDSCQGCFCLGVAVSAELAELAAYFQDYVITRIDRLIELSLLEKNDAVSFVRQMLETRRIGDQSGFYPFSEEAIDNLVSQIVQLTPRRIVKTMYETIEQVRLEGFVPSNENLITSDVLDELDIMEEIIEVM